MKQIIDIAKYHIAELIILVSLSIIVLLVTLTAVPMTELEIKEIIQKVL